MTMEKRIFISNTAIVLISLLILFSVIGGVLFAFEDEYIKILEKEYRLAEHTYEVQGILLNEQNSPKTWEELSIKLKEYNYTTYVTNANKEVQFSNAEKYEIETIILLETVTSTSKDVTLYNIDGGTIARCLFTINDENFNVYAVHIEQGYTPWGMDRGMFKKFIIVFIIMGLVVIAGLLFCSQIFTIKLIKIIMKPVEELNQATQRIKNGNLDQPITYNEKDEFFELCSTFNAMQENLKDGMEKNAAYEKARTEMISGISHDLRTPLTSVKGYVKGMLDGVANTPEKQKKYLEMSYLRACDMDELLQKLFFFSKLETGNMPFFTQHIEMCGWLQNYIFEKQLEEDDKDYSIFLEKESTNCYANIDVCHMQRVFDNLIENSLKYANAINLEINVTIKKVDKIIKITFEDNGNGVDSTKLFHVFEQFYHGDESDGSGLGLYVCKHIIEDHKGYISAKNQNGFVVEIELPLMEKGDLQ